MAGGKHDGLFWSKYFPAVIVQGKLNFGLPCTQLKSAKNKVKGIQSERTLYSF